MTYKISLLKIRFREQFLPYEITCDYLPLFSIIIRNNNTKYILLLEGNCDGENSCNRLWGQSTKNK